jgi:hypothetical protein
LRSRSRILKEPNRIYAVTGKSRLIAAALATVTASQLALGIYLTFLMATHPGGPWALGGSLAFPFQLIALTAGVAVPPIPFDSFRQCVFSRHRRAEVAYTVISLAYGETFQNSPALRNDHTKPVFWEDLLAFSIILYLAGWWKNRQFGIPGLLGTILRDATKYFLVIFTAHLVLAMTLLFARVSSTMSFAK